MENTAKLIDEIYEASVVPDKWPGVFEQIAKASEAALGGVFIAGRAGPMRWAGTEAAEAMWVDFRALHPPLEPIRLQSAAKLQLDGFYTDLDLEDDAVFKHPTYTDFLYPRNYGWFAASAFHLPTGESVHVWFERFRDRGPFEPSAIDTLNGLRPHLGRASVMAAQLGLERARGMTQALNTVGIPAAVLRPNGTLFVGNEAFHKLVPQVVLDRRNRVCLEDSAADRLLGDAIERLSTKGAEGQSRSIPVAARDGRPPLIFHVVPVRGAANDIFSHGLALLMATPVDRSAVPSAEVLQVLFDLTPAESRVARGIAQAKTVDALALESGVSRETVRTQLAAVLNKTGLNRQAELVALLAGKSTGAASESNA